MKKATYATERRYWRKNYGNPEKFIRNSLDYPLLSLHAKRRARIFVNLGRAREFRLILQNGRAAGFDMRQGENGYEGEFLAIMAAQKRTGECAREFVSWARQARLEALEV